MKISNSGAGPKWTRHIKQGRDRVNGDIRWIGLEKAVIKQQPGTNVKGY